jgi:glycyl-tRNA synthetase
VACPVLAVRKIFTDVRKFNLMFKTFQGVTEDTQYPALPASETAQEFCQFQECPAHHPAQDPVRHLPDRQIFRNESHRATSPSAPGV